MANNRQTTSGRQTRKQIVMSEPSRILVGDYISPSGIRKNRYKPNPNAKPVKTITHIADSWK